MDSQFGIVLVAWFLITTNDYDDEMIYSLGGRGGKVLGAVTVCILGTSGCD